MVLALRQANHPVAASEPPSGATVRQRRSADPSTEAPPEEGQSQLVPFPSTSVFLGNAAFWVKQLWEGRGGSRSFAGCVCVGCGCPTHKKEIEGSLCSFQKSSCKLMV